MEYKMSKENAYRYCSICGSRKKINGTCEICGATDKKATSKKKAKDDSTATKELASGSDKEDKTPE